MPRDAVAGWFSRVNTVPARALQSPAVISNLPDTCVGAPPDPRAEPLWAATAGALSVA
jgi:hypothetical protein